MKRFWLPLVAAWCTVCIMSSCLGDNDEITYYDDTAITAFAVSTVNCYQYVTSKSGTDSLVKTTISGSSYKFYIDQLNHEIYNPDSLPYGTDAAHVLCSVSTRNGGQLAIQSMTSDTLMIFNTNDSVNFSQPRKVFVYSNRGTSFQAYTVKVNVHQEQANAFHWNLMAEGTELSALQGMKAIWSGGKMYVWGTANGLTTNIWATADDGASWTMPVPQWNGVLDGNAWKNVVAWNGKMYALSHGMLVATTDGTDLDVVAQAPQLKQLLAAGTGKIYGVNTDGQMTSSTDGGQTWQPETMDTGAEWLPTREVSGCLLKVAADKEEERIVVVGNRDGETYAADANALVWGKLEDYGPNAIAHSWIFYNTDSSNRNLLPRLNQLSVTTYGEGMVALGLGGFGQCTESPLTAIYESRDGGINWRKRSYLPLPASIDKGANALTMAADDRQCLWIICVGQVWRGKLNKLSWDNPQTIFTK